MNLPPDYVCGFVDGEGCFTIVISKHKTKKLGLDARLHFEIELRDDDEEILQNIQKTLNCGRIYHLSYERYGWNPHVELKISSIKEIREKLIPFFQKHKLRGKKRKSFELFVKAAKVFENREHLTMEGIEKLREIRRSMNQYSKKRTKGSPWCGKTARQAARDTIKLAQIKFKS
ncbi:LAGLIDADG family homing endonuclease [Patescibacteria group bacterium]|nr:LAGLIDADG family homing endonuclease [Patescibacteria group bacterium]